mmetsp:Transcript_124242/g.337449  ORF Transcript_124242/g.337449 Transcript_124242/m.337449 type:complete len:226 (-) Transcript_124242:79-756(-)
MQARETSATRSWNDAVASRTASAKRLSCGSSTSSTPSRLSSSDPTASAGAPPSALASVSCISRCASLSWARLANRRLLTAARLCVGMRSKCLTRSSTLPALTDMASAPTEPPSVSTAAASPDPASRISARRQAPAPLRMESKVPIATVKALTTSSATGCSTSLLLSTEAEAPNFVIVLWRYLATFFISSGGTAVPSLRSAPSSSLSSSSPLVESQTRAAAASTWP